VQNSLSVPNLVFSYIGNVTARHSYWASAKLWWWAEGATYIRQGGHRVGHRPTF